MTDDPQSNDCGALVDVVQQLQTKGAQDSKSPKNRTEMVSEDGTDLILNEEF